MLFQRRLSHFRIGYIMNIDPPKYICRRIPDGCIKVDGILDEAEWQSADVIENLMLSDGSGESTRKTSIRLCWDNKYLYIAFECDDPDIWGTMLNRDDSLSDEEVVEAFICPSSKLTDYFEFEMSPLGTLFDADVSNPTGDRAYMTVDRSWDCDGWQTGVHVDGVVNDRTVVDKSWTVEWAIPFPNTPPKDGDIWRINLFRIDRTPEPEFSSWSPTMKIPADFHVPEAFGYLVFKE